jgi:hypothetical protein
MHQFSHSVNEKMVHSVDKAPDIIYFQIFVFLPYQVFSMFNEREHISGNSPQLRFWNFPCWCHQLMTTCIRMSYDSLLI